MYRGRLRHKKKTARSTFFVSARRQPSAAKDAWPWIVRHTEDNVQSGRRPISRQDV